MGKHIHIKAMPILFTIIILISTGCYQKFIADFDPVIYEEIIRVSQEVDLFYIRLIEVADDQRQFEHFQSDYNRIEMEIRTLVLRSALKPYNKNTTSQITRLLDEWIEEKANHKKHDRISAGKAQILREQFAEHFLAIAIGEGSKSQDETSN